MVVQKIFFFDGTEGSQPDMQRDTGSPHPLLPDRLQQLPRKVQPSRRRRRRTFISGINSLITFLIRKLMRDIRRKRHLPEPVQNLLKDPFILKLYETVSLVNHADDLSSEQSIAKADNRPFPRLFAGLHERFPHIVFAASEQEHLDRCTCPGFYPHEPGGDDFGIVQHQTVPLMQIFHNVGEHPVLNRSSLFIEHQKSRTRPVLERVLGDQLWRQVEIKIFLQQFLHNYQHLPKPATSEARCQVPPDRSVSSSWLPIRRSPRVFCPWHGM